MCTWKITTGSGFSLETEFYSYSLCGTTPMGCDFWNIPVVIERFIYWVIELLCGYSTIVGQWIIIMNKNYMSSVPKKTYLFYIKPLILSSMTNFWTRPRVPGCSFRSPSAASIVGTVVPSKMLNLMQVKQSVQKGRLGSLKQPRRRRPQRRLKKHKRFNDKNKSSARASRFEVHFFDVHCTTTTWNLLIWRYMEDVDILRRISLHLLEPE